MRRRNNRTTPPPNILRINQNHPLSRGLVTCVVPVACGFYELFSNQYCIQTTSKTAVPRGRRTIDGNRETAISIVPTAGGPFVFARPTGMDRISSIFSIFAEASLEVNSTIADVCISSESGAGTGFGIRFDDQAVTSDSILYWANNGNVVGSNSILGSNSEQFTHRVMITHDGATARFYGKNILDKSASDTTLPTSNANRRIRMLGNNVNCQASSAALILVWNRTLSLQEYKMLYQNPWQIMELAQSRKVAKAAAAGGVTGTVAVTLANATMAATGTATTSGTIGVTLADATLAASGTAGTSSTGTIGVTLANALMTSSGTAVTSGTIGVTLAAATMASSGAATTTGTIAVTLANAAMAATGPGMLSGTMASTLANATMSASGQEIATGTIGVTLANALMASAGQEIATGTLASALADFALVATGPGLTTGTVAATLANAAMAASGTAVTSGTIGVTLANATMSATAANVVTGTMASTLANAALAASGTAVTSGTIAQTLAAFAMAATGAEIATGSYASTMAAFTMAATDAGGFPIIGTVAVTLANNILAASGYALALSAEMAAYASLMAASPVTAIISDRAYPDNIPELISPPAIAITRTSTDPVNTIHSGAAVAKRVMLDVWCMATTRLAAESLADVTEAALAAGQFYIMDRRAEYSADPEPTGMWSTVVSVFFWE